jgi:hypothetical protein
MVSARAYQCVVYAIHDALFAHQFARELQHEMLLADMEFPEPAIHPRLRGDQAEA